VDEIDKAKVLRRKLFVEEGQQRLVRDRLKQARGSLEEAKTLLDQDAEINFVMNSLYYAFLYPVLGLLQARGITAPMQSTAIALFEAEFSDKGYIDASYVAALRKAFELRPACSCEGQKKSTPEDVEKLLPLAEEFIERVEQLIFSNT
jgi:uncharacterized protein (UPF0332 family)